MASASSTKVGGHIDRISACTVPKVKPNHKPPITVVTFAMGMGRDAVQRECAACRYDCTFTTCSVFLSSGNRCNQNLYSPGVGLHVDTTAHFSSLTRVFCTSLGFI